MKEKKMNNKLTSQKLFNPLIKWLDGFYDTVENITLFQEGDELVEKFGTVSNNFDIRELKEDNTVSKFLTLSKTQWEMMKKLFNLSMKSFWR